MPPMDAAIEPGSRSAPREQKVCCCASSPPTGAAPLAAIVLDAHANPKPPPLRTPTYGDCSPFVPHKTPLKADISRAEGMFLEKQLKIRPKRKKQNGKKKCTSARPCRPTMPGRPCLAMSTDHAWRHWMKKTENHSTRNQRCPLQRRVQRIKVPRQNNQS